ncbi:MAG: hypothetical protein COB38_06730 [Gammaproteobacteria bacterium]|nr:MAG: hypothetical protein COB38_06730 [Gammaproteobacteria bacterium]
MMIKALIKMINFHPQHLELQQEIHARPHPIIKSPCVVSHIAFFHSNKDVSLEYDALNTLARTFQVNGVTPTSNSYFQDFGPFELRWENHREFSTITVIRSANKTGNSNGFALDVFPKDWLSQFPGEAISACHVSIGQFEDITTIEQVLGASAKIACNVMQSQMQNPASIWSSLQTDKEGFTQFVINTESNAESNADTQTGRLLLMILEIETYRQMSLLALPVAKNIAPKATQLGQECAAILANIAKIDTSADESKLLQKLTNVAAEVERLRASSSFRFSATRAYSELVNSRLDELGQQPIEGKDMLGEFLQRRFMPAIRTCASVSLQLESLSKRLTRASDLLRTRVDQTIAEQNQKLLESMNHRSHMQLRLQQTVEGLSVAAISYYLISLLKIVLHGFSEEFFHVNENLVLVIISPIVLLTIFIIVRNMKKHYVDDA